MEIKRYESNGRFCTAVAYGGILYTSGLVDIDQDDFAAQTQGVFKKLDEALEKYGSSRDRILSASCYLKDAADVAVFNELWTKWVMTGHEPVRATIVTEFVHPKILVEIAVVAALK